MAMERGWSWSPWTGALAAFLLGLPASLGVSMERTMGWDEAMHLAAPAVQIAEALRVDERTARRYAALPHDLSLS